MSKHHSSRFHPVVQNVVLHAEPHTLARPSRGASKIQSASLPSAPVNISPEQREQVLQNNAQQAYQAAYQTGLREGKRDGYEQGLKEGLIQAQQEAQSKIPAAIEGAVQQATQAQHERIQRLDALSHTLVSQIDQQLQVAEDDMVALCFETMCRVLGENALTAQGVRQHVNQALQAWRGRARINIHLHPDDVQLLQENSQNESFIKTLETRGYPDTQWVADSQVQLGGCLLRSAEGGLDARLETQLQAMKNTLLQTRATRENHATQQPQTDQGKPA